MTVIFKRICAFFMLIASFFTVLFSGYIRDYPRNRIFLDQYYTSAKDKRRTYDLVIPRSLSGKAGLLLCIHGGGWVEGSKDSYTSSLVQFSRDTGLAAAAVNYRYVSDKINFGDELYDISSALEAIKARGSEFGVDFDRVLLTGISAGGHLSLLYAYTRSESSPVKPVCVVELCGPTDLEDEFFYSEENSVNRAVGPEYFHNIIGNGIGCPIVGGELEPARPAMKKYSPINYIDKDTVPTVFGHGEQDEIVPYRNALDLDAKLTECGVEHTFISFPRSGHGCEDKASMSEIMKLFFEYADEFLK